MRRIKPRNGRKSLDSIGIIERAFGCFVNKRVTVRTTNFIVKTFDDGGYCFYPDYSKGRDERELSYNSVIAELQRLEKNGYLCVEKVQRCSYRFTLCFQRMSDNSMVDYTYEFL